MVQDGHRIVRWSEPVGTALAEVIDPHDPWLDGTSEILSYWHKLNRGAAQIVGEDDFDGRAVWVVEVERGTGGDAPLDLEVVAELDRSTFLPCACGRTPRKARSTPVPVRWLIRKPGTLTGERCSPSTDD